MVVGRRQSTVSGRSGQPGPSAASRVQLALNTARGSAMVRSMKASSVKDHRAKTKTASTECAQVTNGMHGCCSNCTNVGLSNTVFSILFSDQIVFCVTELW